MVNQKVEVDNEIGNKTLDELKTMFDVEIAKIRESALAPDEETIEKAEAYDYLINNE